jgi:hypothetical protein
MQKSSIKALYEALSIKEAGAKISVLERNKDMLSPSEFHFWYFVTDLVWSINKAQEADDTSPGTDGVAWACYRGSVIIMLHNNNNRNQFGYEIAGQGK